MMTPDQLHDQIEAALLAGQPTTVLRRAFAQAAAAAEAEAEQRRAAEDAATAAAGAAIDAAATLIAAEAESDLLDLLACLTPPTLMEDMDNV